MRLDRPAMVFAITIVAVAFCATQTLAQQHHHYKVIDIGTLGGPSSYLTICT